MARSLEGQLMTSDTDPKAAKVALQMSSKTSKKDANYRTPADKDDLDRCGSCGSFRASDKTCKKVQGGVKPEDVCDLYDEG